MILRTCFLGQLCTTSVTTLRREPQTRCCWLSDVHIAVTLPLKVPTSRFGQIFSRPFLMPHKIIFWGVGFSSKWSKLLEDLFHHEKLAEYAVCKAVWCRTAGPHKGARLARVLVWDYLRCSVPYCLCRQDHPAESTQCSPLRELAGPQRKACGLDSLDFRIWEWNGSWQCRYQSWDELCHPQRYWFLHWLQRQPRRSTQTLTCGFLS